VDSLWLVVARVKEKKQRREVIEKHYEKRLKTRVLCGLKMVIDWGHEADLHYEKSVVTSALRKMVHEYRSRVKSREEVADMPGINHWNKIAYKHVVDRWRIATLHRARDNQGLRLAIGVHRVKLMKRAFGWLVEYRNLIGIRERMLRNAVEFHEKGLYVEAFMRWVYALERGSEMRLLSTQVELILLLVYRLLM
jgi:hypothetical protein